VYWLYREEGLAVRRKRRHNRVTGTARVPLGLPTRANQLWTMGSPNTR